MIMKAMIISLFFILTDSCEGVRCGHNAECVEGRCICKPGFKGDPDDECRSDETGKINISK